MYNILRTKKILQGNEKIMKGLRETGFLRQQVPRLGLVGEWMLNGNSIDTSGEGNGGTDTNISYTDTTFSYNGKEGVFSGSSSYVTIADANSLDVTTLSISCRIKTAVTSEQYILCKNDNTGPNDSFFLDTGRASASKLSFSNNISTITSVASVCDGLWHHCVAIHIPTVSGSLYIDGLLDITSAMTGTPQIGVASTYIGCRGTPGLYPYRTGSIMLVRLYNRALSQKDVSILYSEGLALLN